MSDGIPMERMTPEEIARLKLRYTNRDGSAEALCSKAWAHIALQDAEIEKLRDVLSGVLWMADEWFDHGGDETAFSDDHAASLEAARAFLSASQPANACQDTQAAHLQEVTRLRARVEELEGALERIDRIEVYDEDARETLRSKLGVMRDIARAVLSASQPAPSQLDDAVNYGIGITLDGKRIDPQDFYLPPAPSALPVLSDEFVRAEMDAMQARENKRLETLFTQPAPPLPTVSFKPLFIGCICPPTSEQTCQNPTCPRGPSAHD